MSRTSSVRRCRRGLRRRGSAGRTRFEPRPPAYERRGVARALLEAADVDVVRLPDEVGAALPVPDDLADESLEIVAGLIERPALGSDLRLLEAVDHPSGGLLDLGVLLAKTPHVPGEPGRALEDL